MPALTEDFPTLLLQRQAVDFHHVVEHPGENGDDVLIGVPVETGFFRERVLDELGEVHRSEQARAVGRKCLFAAIVSVKAIGVEGIDPRNLGIVCVLDAIDPQLVDHRSESLLVERPLVLIQQRMQALLFPGIGKTDALGECAEVDAADHQFMLGLDRVGRAITTAIR